MKKLFKVMCIALVVSFVSTAAVKAADIILSTDLFLTDVSIADYDNNGIIITGNLKNESNMNYKNILIFSNLDLAAGEDQAKFIELDNIKAGRVIPFKCIFENVNKDLLISYGVVGKIKISFGYVYIGEKPKPKPEECIYSFDLMDEYKANEVRAANKYKGKKVAVEGTITSIQEDMFGNAYFVLDNVIVAMLRSSSRQLAVDSNVGDFIQIKGTVDMCLLQLNLTLLECYQIN